MPVPRWWRDAAAPLWAATAAVWLVLLAVPALAGTDPLLRHGASAGPVGGNPPRDLAMWTLMVATMLPAAAPALRRLGRAGACEHPPAPARPVVVTAYLAAWLGFGGLGLAGQVAVHATLARWAWLGQRPTLVAAAVLAVAGLYQFSSARRLFLTTCQDPCGVLDGPSGPGRSWRIGLRLAAASLGCCWALMLAMLALGSLVAMVGLTLTTGAEMSTGWGSRLAGPVGVVLLYAAAALALTTLAAPPAPVPALRGW
jgi:predicted metal-binding membrane protein